VDDITAGEIERIAYARREFDLVLSGLTPSRWEDSRDLLYDNEQLFFEHLEGDSKTHAMDLIAFFRDIDAGDRLIGKTDIRKQDIDGAEKHYVDAEKKAKTLPPSMAVMFLVRMKTHAVSEKRAAIERDRQMRLAAQDFDKILADLTPSGWENAKKQLYRNEVVFKENLEGQRKTDALNLIQFFRDIEEGDRILGQKGATRRDVDIASEMFNRAGDVAKLLPANVNVQFILTARTREISEMNRRLDRKQQTALAESSFEDVISGLTVSNWEASREMLYANEGLFSEYLAGKPQRDARNLVEFFRRIDDGDRIAQKTDATVQELDGAMALYDNAGKTKKQLSGGIEVQFIVILKKSAVALKKDELQRRQHRLAANQMFDNALADLTPDNWKQSRDQLYANETVLSENLEGIRKTDALILIAYFRSIDKGDRTITTRGHTLEGLEAAVTHYTAAGEIAKGLSSTVDVDFLTSQKLASGATRTAQLQTTERQDIANERFNDALANLTPKKWEQSREILYANETLFSEHLSGNRKTDALTLIALFQAIDAGDRTIETRGQTLEGVEAAMTHYTAADDLARQLSSAVDVRFLTTRKLTAGTTLTANLKTAKASDIANDRFDNVLADLTPGKWEQSRDLLYANETFFSEHLSGNRKTDAVILIAYFRSIDEGDRTMAARGNTVEGVAAAMTHYTAAGEKAKGLSSAANVRFLTALKLDAGAALRAELQQGEQRRVADATFAEVLAALRPETWQQSRDLLYANEQMLSEHLDSTKERDALTLIRFFRDIDEGDRQLVSGSPSIAELEAALRFYRRAEVMAELMQHRVDALFVPRQRIEQTSDQLTQLRAAERERIAAERIAAAQAAAQIPRTAPASTPTATARPASVPQKIYPPKTELKLAMSSFNKQSYDSSLIHFSHVYKDEIDQIKGKGKTRLLGVMALPSSHRAEVLFLLYYDRLKKTYNDEERVKDGLARLNSKVENGAGLWAIVSDQKRRKITRHINVYVSE